MPSYCEVPTVTSEYSNITVTLNTVDTRYVHWRHIPRVQVKVKDNQYIDITYNINYRAVYAATRADDPGG